MNKYIDATGEKLNDISMNGFCDDTSGSVEYGLWSGKVNVDGMLAIIQEDDQGFFNYTLYDSEADMELDWLRILESDKPTHDWGWDGDS